MLSVYSFFASLKRGLRSFRSVVSVPVSSYSYQILLLLYREGYIQGFSLNKGKYDVWLKYKGQMSMFANIRMVSKPGRRVYMNRNDLVAKYGMGSAVVVSGPQGLFIYRRGSIVPSGGEVLVEF